MKSQWISLAFSMFACSVQAQSIFDAASPQSTAAEQWGLERAQDGSFSALSGGWRDPAARYEDERRRRQPSGGWSRGGDFDRGEDDHGGDDDDRGPVSAVPEPASFVLLASGAAVALILSTRRRWRESR